VWRILAQGLREPGGGRKKDCDIRHENVSFTQAEKGLSKTTIEASGVHQDDIAGTLTDSDCMSVGL
jgi:hypothetical protein